MTEPNGLPIRVALILSLLTLGLGGCATTSPRWIDQPWTPLDYETSRTDTPDAGQAVYEAAESGDAEAMASEGRGVLVDLTQSRETTRDTGKNETSGQEIIRGQDPGSSITPRYPVSSQNTGYVPPATPPLNGGQPIGQPAQQPGPYGGGTYVPPGTTQTYQVTQPALTPGQQVIVPNQQLPVVGPGVGGDVIVPPNFADIDVLLREAQTGRITFGAAYNSNSGLVGQIIVDERNFDILGFPRSWEDIVNGTAWRGRGQGFRLELVPGNEVQRYLVNFPEPYLFNTPISFSASGYFFDRRYFDWDEQRLGGRFNLGYRLTPDLSISAGVRAESVDIHDPRVATSPTLNAAVGTNGLYVGSVSLISDTRDHPFMASAGSYLELAYHQAFGDFSYPRGDLDYRRYFLIYQRPDGSGRHTLSLGTKLGVSGSDTPVFENYFAGGFSTLRGFDFRGASPLEGGVRVGGRFQWLNTVEYTFPITADDMFKGVLFCDFGTVEREIKLNSENFRVAPGFGFRVHMPVGGAGGAPLAFDFAFPVMDAFGDDRQIFSFYMGVLR